VRRWEAEGRITARRTASGQRYFDDSDVRAALQVGTDRATRRTVVYCRVSSPGQKNDLVSQVAAMRLFSLGRAEAAENTDQRRQWREKAALRSGRAKAVTDAKRAALLAEVAALRISVPVMDFARLAELAVAHRNRINASWAADRGYEADPATVDGVDKPTLHRWMENYLRHARTVYDAALDGLYARVGRAQATDAIRDRVYAVIAETYAELAAEARRQAAERAATA
jgi:hypothetical protein